MATYRKKPVEIEAVKFVYTLEGIDELIKFCGPSLGVITKARHMNAFVEAEIKTLEDGSYSRVVHVATEGDFIIKGVHGEFYPCKPEIFEKTYEFVHN